MHVIKEKNKLDTLPEYCSCTESFWTCTYYNYSAHTCMYIYINMYRYINYDQHNIHGLFGMMFHLALFPTVKTCSVPFQLLAFVEICRTWPYRSSPRMENGIHMHQRSVRPVNVFTRMELLVGGELEFVAWLPWDDVIGGGFVHGFFVGSTWRFVKLMPTLQWKMYQCTMSRDSLVLFAVGGSSTFFAFKGFIFT